MSSDPSGDDSTSTETPRTDVEIDVGEDQEKVVSKKAGGLPDGATEEATERDGVLSYAVENHAFAHGVYLGFTTKPWITPIQPDDDDVSTELHYYRGGYIIGTILQILTLMGLAVAGYEAGLESLVSV